MNSGTGRQERKRHQNRCIQHELPAYAVPDSVSDSCSKTAPLKFGVRHCDEDETSILSDRSSHALDSRGRDARSFIAQGAHHRATGFSTSSRPRQILPTHLPIPALRPMGVRIATMENCLPGRAHRRFIRNTIDLGRNFRINCGRVV